MRRLFLGLALAAVATGCGGGHPKAVSPFSRFRPELVAGAGTQDIWLLGHHGLLRSMDAGRHFVRVAAPPLPAEGAEPTVRFANARDGFAYTRDSTRLFVTHDGGRSWHASGPRRAVSAFAVGGGEVYAVFGRSSFARVPIGGGAWRALPLPLEPALGFFLAARGHAVWLLGRRSSATDNFDRLARSTDGGRRFTVRTGPCFADLGGGLVPAGGGIVWAVCPTGMMAGLSLSTDGGLSFPALGADGSGEPPMTNGAQLAAISAHAAVLDGGAQGVLYRTADAGRHWTLVEGTAHLDGVSSVVFSTSRVGYLLATMRPHPNRAELWRTTDGGVSWHAVSIG